MNEATGTLGTIPANPERVGHADSPGSEVMQNGILHWLIGADATLSGL
jgi:hypothetical protein